jgi:hypothetical protein
MFSKEFFSCRPGSYKLIKISKASGLCSAIVLSQEDSKLVDPVLQGVRKALIFTSNAIILQFVWSTFWKLFSHLILIV